MIKLRKGSVWLAAVAAFLAVAALQATSRPKPTASEALVDLYVPIQEGLAADSAATVKEQAAKIASHAAAAVGDGADRVLYEAIATAAQGMTGADIASLREQLKPLSRALAQLFEKVPVAGYGIYYCPMADAYWLQAVGDVRNPYYGRRMTTCGTQVTKVED